MRGKNYLDFKLTVDHEGNTLKIGWAWVLGQDLHKFGLKQLITYTTFCTGGH